MKRPFGLNCNPSNGVPFEAAAFAPQEAPVKIGHTSTLVHNIHIGSTKWVNNKLVNKYTLVNTLVNKYTLVVHIGGTGQEKTIGPCVDPQKVVKLQDDDQLTAVAAVAPVQPWRGLP